MAKYQIIESIGRKRKGSKRVQGYVVQVKTKGSSEWQTLHHTWNKDKSKTQRKLDSLKNVHLAKTKYRAVEKVGSRLGVGKRGVGWGVQVLEGGRWKYIRGTWRQTKTEANKLIREIKRNGKREYITKKTRVHIPKAPKSKGRTQGLQNYLDSLTVGIGARANPWNAFSLGMDTEQYLNPDKEKKKNKKT